MIDKQFDYLLALNDTRNISKAATKLGITQSSLSKFLIRQEEKVGFTIFDRTSSPLKLTPEGKYYMEYVHEVLERNVVLNQKIKSIEGTPHGDLVFGMTSWRSEVLLPSILPSFMKKYPLIKVKLCEGNHENIYSMLERNEIEFAIVNLQMNYNEYIFESMNLERILIAINKDSKIIDELGINPPKRKGKLMHVDFSLLQDEPVIQLKPGQNLQLLSKNFLSANGYRNKIIFETKNIGTAYRLVEEGMGITFIPEGFLHEERSLRKAYFFTTGNPVLSWNLGVTYKIRMKLSDNTRLMINHMKDFFSQQG
ncbi:TPA: LysR family transcriptional regulator [Klebsiella pneumoniae]|nr:LysR family transcriptional regulator [Klebsiella pneumoniae]